MDRNTALSLFARADALYRGGDYAQALLELRRLTGVFSENPTVLYATALCLERLDRRDEALALCDRLVLEHHHDRAVILKARLITTPESPEEYQKRQGIDAGWPEEKIFAAAANAAHPLYAAPYAWYVAAVVCCAAVMTSLFAFTLVFAQAETVVPGAMPTLFPARLLAGCCIAAFASASAMVFCFAGAEPRRKDASMRAALLKSVCIGVLCLIPVFGWFAAATVMRRRVGFSLLKSVLILSLILALQLLVLAIAAWALGLTGMTDIYMELVAGYG